MNSTRMRSWLINGATIVALGAVIAIGWAKRKETAPVGQGSIVPEYTALALDGDSVSLDELRGRVVLLNVWATWCPPCRWEMPAMQRLHQSLHAEGLEVVAVSVDARPGEVDHYGRPGGDVAKMVDELGLDFRVLLDPRGTVQRRFGVQGLPTTFVIDREGRVARKVMGPVHWDASPYLDLIRELLEA